MVGPRQLNGRAESRQRKYSTLKNRSIWYYLDHMIEYLWVWLTWRPVTELLERSRVTSFCQLSIYRGRGRREGGRREGGREGEEEEEEAREEGREEREREREEVT